MKKDKSIKQEFVLEILAFLIIGILIFTTMYYWDNQLTFVYIIDNMHRIAQGKWYYLFNGWSAIPYGLILQAACAIWSIPVFILSEFGVITTTCVGARIWYKIFVLIFLMLDTWQLGIIARKIGIKNENKIMWIRLYFVSSLLVALPALHIAQMDAVYLFLILLGLGFYLSNDYWKFLLCFAIAIPIKFIPLFLFIPLVLLKEKRYLYIIRDLGIGCIGILIDKAIKSVGYRIEGYLGVDPRVDVPDVSDVVMQSSIGNLLGTNLEAFNSKLSIAFLLFFILCIWCYLQKAEIKHNFTILVSFLGLSCLFIFGTVAPYWILLLVPFTLLLIFKNDKFYHILLPLELAFACGFIYIFIFKTKWVYGAEDTFSFLLFTLIPGYMEQTHGYIADFISQRGLDGFEGVFSAMMVACLVGIAVCTNPLKEIKAEKVGKDENYIKGWYWIRILVLLAWVMLNILVVACNYVAA